MNERARRFVDWLERFMTTKPASITIWFIPLVFIIGGIALIVNKLNSRKDIVTR